MSLDQIAIRHRTDKSTLHHGYTLVYEKHFGPLRNKPLVLLELGAGAYHKKEDGFYGAKTWAEYFSIGVIHSIDIYDKTPPDHPRVHFHRGSQDDYKFLHELVKKIGVPDIIIDDASHINPLTVRSFEILFPLLKAGGIYVIEDCHTSYWSEPATDGTLFYGGINNATSILNVLKGLVDVVNHEHSGVPDQKIKSIHFYEKIVFVNKNETHFTAH